MKKLFLVAFAVVLAASCGNNKKKDSKTDVKADAKTETQAPAKEATEATDSIAKVVISANDKMEYDKSEIHVKAGQTVELTLKHTGKMSAKVMGHDWVLLAQGTDMQALGMAAAKNGGDLEKLPAKFKNAIIAHTKMIGGGQTTTITFKAPAAGTYDYMCSFPGHYVKMHGKFIVE